MDSKPLEVLVIDDEPSIRILLKSILKRNGCNVTLASSGNEGIGLYFKSVESKNPYGLVLTDLMMPSGDGTDVTREVKSRNPSTAVYVITGYEHSEQYGTLREKLGALSPDGVIPKPIESGLIAGIAQRVASGGEHRQFVADYLLKLDVDRKRFDI